VNHWRRTAGELSSGEAKFVKELAPSIETTGNEFYYMISEW
jgi:hypothetical protein